MAMFAWKNSKVSGYSHNLLKLPSYDPWVGIKIALVFTGVLMYYTARFLYRVVCVPDGNLSHYER